MRLTPTEKSQGARPSQRLVSPRLNLTKYPSPHANSASDPFQVADTYTEKAIVVTLMAIDALSHISPFRWLFDAKGCGGKTTEPVLSDKKSEKPSSGCTKDTDCHEPSICVGGLCYFPPVPNDDSSKKLVQKPDAVETPSLPPPPHNAPVCKGGEIKDFYTGPAETIGVGICQAGELQCRHENWVEVRNQITPRSEIFCNDEDEDCNGTALQGTDQDGDGYKVEGGLCGPQDCDDTNPSIHPDAPASACIGMDYNCDRRITFKELGEILLIEEHAPLSASSLVWTGSEFGLAWNPTRRDGLRFTRISAEGEVSDETVIEEGLGSDRVWDGSLVWSGSVFGVSWLAHAVPRGRTRRRNFAVLNSLGNRIGDIVQHTDRGFYPKVVWDGRTFTIASTGMGDVEGLFLDRVDLNGNRTTQTQVSNGRTPALVWTGSEYGLTWNDNPPPTDNVFFSSFDSSLRLLRTTLLKERGTNMDLVWNGFHYGVCLEDTSERQGEVRFMTLDREGNILSDTLVTDRERFPDIFLRWEPFHNCPVVWTGSEFTLIIDPVYHPFVFARINNEGELLDLHEMSRPGYGENPSLVWTGSDYGLSFNGGCAASGGVCFARIGCQ